MSLHPGWLLLALVLGAISEASAQAEDAAGRFGRQVAFSVLTDVPASAGIQDVCCGLASFGEPTTSFRTRYGDTPVWLRLDAPGDFDLLMVSLVVDRAVAFFRVENRQRAGTEAGLRWARSQTGDLVGPASRDVANPHMVLPMAERVPGTDIYVRIEQPVMTTVRLWAADWPEFQAMDRADHLFKAFLTGIILATIAYNGLVGGLVRSPAFLLNAATIGALLLLALYLSGYGVAYVWSAVPQLSNVMLLAAVYCGILFGGGFISEFLREEGQSRAKGLPLMVPAMIASVAMVGLFIFPYWYVQPVLLLCAAALFLLAFPMVCIRARNGSRQARLLLFPLGFAMIPGMAFVVLEKLFGVRLGLVENNLLEVTLCLEAVLFSLAIASRFRMGEMANREMSLKLMGLRAEGAAKAIAAQDSERQRLAKELHDGVGQDFLVVLGSLKKLEREKKSADWTSALPSLIATTTAALDELRRISKEMHPASISHLGLEKALEMLFEHLETSDQIETRVHLDFDEARLSPTCKLHVYRIVQECLANISRHSGASACHASICQDGDRLHLDIGDDGTGLEPGAGSAPPAFGLGFTSIDERIRSLGGDWHLGSSELGGVSVTASFPLRGTGAGGGS
ncbi:sensor histidine kinase [Hoeflea sp.]|uniref:sensor histidine kinase n=1 Tax=Hoeflea sp. TaxID=1940281 RepID=UPI003BB002FB